MTRCLVAAVAVGWDMESPDARGLLTSADAALFGAYWLDSPVHDRVSCTWCGPGWAIAAETALRAPLTAASAAGSESEAEPSPLSERRPCRGWEGVSGLPVTPAVRGA